MQPPMQPLLEGLAAILVLGGLVGTVMPPLPGLPLIFAGLLLDAWADGFHHVGPWMLGALALLTLIATLLDFWVAGAGAKRAGASRQAVIGATLGTLAGAFVPPFGVFIGPFVGALGGELLHRRSLARTDLGAATRVGVATWLGLAAGIAMKLGTAFLMIGLFAMTWWMH